jgi:hypothetical protein
VQLGDRVEAGTRVNSKEPLRELSENTGGFAVLDSNDYRKPMERLAADLGGFYEITYAPRPRPGTAPSARPRSR